MSEMKKLGIIGIGNWGKNLVRELSKIHCIKKCSSNGNLKNIAGDLKQVEGRFVFKSSVINRLIENSDMSLSSVRETSRYLVGLLVFLGFVQSSSISTS